MCESVRQVSSSKGPDKIRPINEPENETEEITVKDYERGFWSVKLNIDGETTIIGWGSGKHLTIWGGIIVSITVIGLFLIRHFRVKKKKGWERFVNLSRNKPRK